MANDNIGRSSQSAPPITGKGDSPPSVSTHVGRNSVEIDPNALKHLIDTLRASSSPAEKALDHPESATLPSRPETSTD
jgi:hypothetical protein